MPHSSSCEPDSARNLLYDVLGLSEESVDKLEGLGILSKHRQDGSGILAPGCWMPRRVDAMAVIVVDALRFDFALEHLPNSVGARLAKERRLETSLQEQKESSLIAANDVNANANANANDMEQCECICNCTCNLTGVIEDVMDVITDLSPFPDEIIAPATVPEFESAVDADILMVDVLSPGNDYSI
jgi:hypothetical protein